MAAAAGVTPLVPTVAAPTVSDVRNELKSAVADALRTFTQSQQDFNEKIRDEQRKMKEINWE